MSVTEQQGDNPAALKDTRSLAERYEQLTPGMTIDQARGLMGDLQSAASEHFAINGLPLATYIVWFEADASGQPPTVAFVKFATRRLAANSPLRLDEKSLLNGAEAATALSDVREGRTGPNASPKAQ